MVRPFALQRQYGSKHVWKTVERLRRSGTTAVPAVGMGKYAYRIHIVKQRRPLANSRTRWLYSYGTTHLSTLCSGDQIEFDYSCNSDTIAQVGSTVFSYFFYDGNAATDPAYDQLLAAPRSSCRSITVEWGIDNVSGGSGDAATLQITRSDADPVASTADYGTVGTLTAPLDRGAWAMNTWVANTNNYNAVVVNDATLSCFTRSGVS